MSSKYVGSGKKEARTSFVQSDIRGLRQKGYTLTEAQIMASAERIALRYPRLAGQKNSRKLYRRNRNS